MTHIYNNAGTKAGKVLATSPVRVLTNYAPEIQAAQHAMDASRDLSHHYKLKLSYLQVSRFDGNGPQLSCGTAHSGPKSVSM